MQPRSTPTLVQLLCKRFPELESPLSLLMRLQVWSIITQRRQIGRGSSQADSIQEVGTKFLLILVVPTATFLKSGSHRVLMCLDCVLKDHLRFVSLWLRPSMPASFSSKLHQKAFWFGMLCQHNLFCQLTTPSARWTSADVIRKPSKLRRSAGLAPGVQQQVDWGQVFDSFCSQHCEAAATNQVAWLCWRCTSTSTSAKGRSPKSCCKACRKLWSTSTEEGRPNKRAQTCASSIIGSEVFGASSEGTSSSEVGAKGAIASTTGHNNLQNGIKIKIFGEERTAEGERFKCQVESVKIQASTCPRCFAAIFKGRSSATSVDSCWVLQRPTTQRSLSAERKNSGSSGCTATSSSSRSPAASWMRSGFSTIKHVAVQALKQIISTVPNQGLRARWTWDSSRCWTGIQKMPPSPRACSMKATMSTTASTMTCCGVHAHLPKPDRTRAQVRLGTSESSQLEHNAMRLVYLDIASEKDAPDRTTLVVHVQSWNLFRGRVHWAFGKKPTQLTTFFCPTQGLIRLQCMMQSDIWNRSNLTTLTSTSKMLRKREGSLNEPKRRMRQSAKLSRRLHLDKLHQRKAPLIRLPTASLSTSARAWLDAPQSASGDREYTGQWVKWHGKWWQKVVRYGRTEWEES